MANKKTIIINTLADRIASLEADLKSVTADLWRMGTALDDRFDRIGELENQLHAANTEATNAQARAEVRPLIYDEIMLLSNPAEMSMNKITAIKAVRKVTGFTLRDAKDIVDQIIAADEHRIADHLRDAFQASKAHTAL